MDPVVIRALASRVGVVADWMVDAPRATTALSRLRVSNALVERFAQDDISMRLETKGKDDLAPSDVSAQRRAERVLARYASRRVPCSSARDLDEEPSAVQLRYVVQPLTPWSKLHGG